MSANVDKPWQKLNGFQPQGAHGDAIYQYFDERIEPRTREATVAQMVAAAYNSPDIITTTIGDINELEAKFSDGVAQGSNARTIALQLYEAKLFRRV